MKDVRKTSYKIIVKIEYMGKSTIVVSVMPTGSAFYLPKGRGLSIPSNFLLEILEICFSNSSTA